MSVPRSLPPLLSHTDIDRPASFPLHRSYSVRLRIFATEEPLKNNADAPFSLYSCVFEDMEDKECVPDQFGLFRSLEKRKPDAAFCCPLVPSPGTPSRSRTVLSSGPTSLLQTSQALLAPAEKGELRKDLPLTFMLAPPSLSLWTNAIPVAKLCSVCPT